MKYMMMMHTPRGTGDYQIDRWSAAPACTATATRRRGSAWSPRARC